MWYFKKIVGLRNVETYTSENVSHAGTFLLMENLLVREFRKGGAK